MMVAYSSGSSLHIMQILLFNTYSYSKFLIKNGEIITPGKDSSILLGITRESIIELASEIGYTVKERFVHREELYTADELFFVGTAAEVTPIVNVDGIIIGDGKTGKETDIFEYEINFSQGI